MQPKRKRDIVLRIRPRDDGNWDIKFDKNPVETAKSAYIKTYLMGAMAFAAMVGGVETAYGWLAKLAKEYREISEQRPGDRSIVGPGGDPLSTVDRRNDEPIDTELPRPVRCEPPAGRNTADVNDRVQLLESPIGD